jgi:hypothetical protein
VWAFGVRVEADIDAATEGKSGGQAKAAAKMALDKWLGTTDSKGTFRDPASMAGR